MKNKLILALVFAGLGAGIANAQGTSIQPLDPGFHSHDGFYLSMCVGPGVMGYKDDFSPDYDKVSHSVANLDFKIGGAILRDQLILSGDIVGSSASNPTVHAEQDGMAQTGEYDELEMTLIGVGVTHYFMPENAFISGTFGVGQFTVSYTDQDGISHKQSSDNGFGLQLKAGKEWWVSSNWGLGVSAVFLHVTVPNQSNNQYVSESVNGNSFAVLFNTTFN